MKLAPSGSFALPAGAAFLPLPIPDGQWLKAVNGAAVWQPLAPAGGSGQILARKSNTTLDMAWQEGYWVNTLPTTGLYDQMRVIYNPPNTSCLWQLQYSGGYWFFIGGPPLFAYEGNAVNLGGCTTPYIPVAYRGVYTVRYGTGVYVYTSGSAALIGTLTAPGFSDSGFQIFCNSGYASMGSAEKQVSCTAGNVYVQYGATVGTILATVWRFLAITPIYLQP